MKQYWKEMWADKAFRVWSAVGLVYLAFLIASPHL
jgi:hypothetical protein